MRGGLLRFVKAPEGHCQLSAELRSAMEDVRAEWTMADFNVAWTGIKTHRI